MVSAAILYYRMQFSLTTLIYAITYKFLHKFLLFFFVLSFYFYQLFVFV